MAPSTKASKTAGGASKKATKKAAPEENGRMQGGLQRWMATKSAAPGAQDVEQKSGDAAAPAVDARSEEAPQAVAPSAAVESRSPSKAPGHPAELDQKQLSLIEEKRRQALERRQKGAGSDIPVATSASTVSPAKTPGTRGGSPNLADTTPEKLSCPVQEKLHSPTPPAREAHEALNEKFARLSCGDWMQYNHFYNKRLAHLRGGVLDEARALWGGVVAPEGFAGDLTQYRQAGSDGESGGEAVLVGLVFKELKSRPSVIDMYKGVMGSLPESSSDDRQNLCSDDDVLWLEDGTMRLQLVLPKEQVGRLATGFVVGVLGAPTCDGTFKVKGVCLARAPVPPPLPSPPPAAAGHSQGPYLALVSGLAFGAADADGSAARARGRAADFLAEHAGGVRRLVVCGGLFDAASLSAGSGRKASLEGANAFLARLCASVAVDVMPAEREPTNVSLPQMPLHPHLFRRVRDEAAPGAFRCVSNPHAGSLEGLSLLGHSGQPVEDLLRCTRLAAPLQALELCLEASHLAPTAPDTLATQPFAEEDPFVIDAAPHVLFSGGHGREAHSWHPSSVGESGTTCVCVPAFHRHPAVVLVNLRRPQEVRVEQFGDAQMEGVEQQPCAGAS